MYKRQVCILAGILPAYLCVRHGRYAILILCVPFPPVPDASQLHIGNKGILTAVAAQRSQSGLDYTKSILIKDNAYIDATVPALVDQDEYKETMVNLPRIVQLSLIHI